MERMWAIKLGYRRCSSVARSKVMIAIAEEGAKAREQGLELSANPYKGRFFGVRQTRAIYAWEYGWKVMNYVIAEYELKAAQELI